MTGATTRPTICAAPVPATMVAAPWAIPSFGRAALTRAIRLIMWVAMVVGPPRHDSAGRDGIPRALRGASLRGGTIEQAPCSCLLEVELKVDGAPRVEVGPAGPSLSMVYSPDPSVNRYERIPELVPPVWGRPCTGYRRLSKGEARTVPPSEDERLRQGGRHPGGSAVDRARCRQGDGIGQHLARSDARSLLVEDLHGERRVPEVRPTRTQRLAYRRRSPPDTVNLSRTIASGPDRHRT